MKNMLKKDSLEQMQFGCLNVVVDCIGIKICIMIVNLAPTYLQYYNNNSNSN